MPRALDDGVGRLDRRIRLAGHRPSELAPKLLVALGALRLLIGGVALACPRLPAAAWVGKEASRNPALRLFARALGGRDLALGLGAVLHGGDHAALSRWAAVGALADACDVGATVLAYRHLPRHARLLVIASAGGAAAAGALGVALVSGAANETG